jgi:pimeloyl-ACP methyl ester carboxylesterase
MTADQVNENECTKSAAPTAERRIPWLSRGWNVRAMRAVFRVLCAFAPAFAARIVDRLWFTPPKSRVRPDVQKFLRNADKELSFKVNGRALSAWSWGQGPVVILMHGWGGNAGQLRSFVEPLVQAGFRAVAFDAPAHGASDAARSGDGRVNFVEFAHALQEVDREIGPAVGLIAHSGGCTAASLALRDGWCAPPRLVFIAPFVFPNAYMAPFGSALAISPDVMAEFRARAQHRLGRPLYMIGETMRCLSRMRSSSLRLGGVRSSWKPQGSGIDGSCMTAQSLAAPLRSLRIRFPWECHFEGVSDDLPSWRMRVAHVVADSVAIASPISSR